MPDMIIQTIESLESGFAANVILGRDHAHHIGFVDQSEAQLWSMRMGRKIAKQQSKVRQLSCVPREFEMPERSYLLDS